MSVSGTPEALKTPHCTLNKLSLKHYTAFFFFLHVCDPSHHSVRAMESLHQNWRKSYKINRDKNPLNMEGRFSEPVLIGSPSFKKTRSCLMALFWNHTLIQTSKSSQILASHHAVSTLAVFHATFTLAFDTEYYCTNTKWKTSVLRTIWRFRVG